jgi:hypothetical protein
MKISQVIVFLTLLIFLVSSCQNKKTNGHEVWEKYLENFGSYDIELEYKSIIDSSMSIFNDDTAYNATRIVYPNKINHKVYKSNGEIITLITNGNKGVIISNGSKQELSKEYLESYKNFGLIYPEFYYQLLGYSIDLIGEDIIDEIPYYKIEVTNDTLHYIYFISKSDLEINKMISGESTVKVLELFKVDGITFIKKSKITDNQGTTYRFRINTKLNTPIDENYFKL